MENRYSSIPARWSEYGINVPTSPLKDKEILSFFINGDMFGVENPQHSLIFLYTDPADTEKLPLSYLYPLNSLIFDTSNYVTITYEKFIELLTALLDVNLTEPENLVEVILASGEKKTFSHINFSSVEHVHQERCNSMLETSFISILLKSLARCSTETFKDTDILTGLYNRYVKFANAILDTLYEVNIRFVENLPSLGTKVKVQQDKTSFTGIIQKYELIKGKLYGTVLCTSKSRKNEVKRISLERIQYWDTATSSFKPIDFPYFNYATLQSNYGSLMNLYGVSL